MIQINKINENLTFTTLDLAQFSMSGNHGHEKDDYRQNLRISKPEPTGGQLVCSIKYGDGFENLVVCEVLFFGFACVSVVGYLGNSLILPLSVMLSDFWKTLTNFSHLGLNFYWVIDVLYIQYQL